MMEATPQSLLPITLVEVTVALPELSKENFDGYTITWSVSGDWTLTAEGAAPGEGAKSATATLKGTAPYTDSDKAYTFTITMLLWLKSTGFH